MSAAATVVTHTKNDGCRWILNSNLWVMPRQQHQGSFLSNVSQPFFCFDMLSVVRKNVQLFTIVQVIDDVVSEVLE